jgi:hypothetical protein
MALHSRPSTPNTALAWALLSQTIWLPLMALDLHDRWQAQIREQAAIAEAALRRSHLGQIRQTLRPGAATTANGKLTDTGILLGSASHSPLNPANRSDLLSEPNLDRFSPNGPSRTGSRWATSNPAVPSAAAVKHGDRDQPRDSSPLVISNTGWQPTLLHTFNRAELLGGTIGLRDLNSAPMPPLAMAERARWQGSGDPLAPLPGAWREPMRRALHGLAASKGAPSTVTAARVVHVPSLRVQKSTPVPVAVQSDGSVDILTKPDNPAVVDEIRQWSSRQSTSGQPGVTAAVVHLEPLPEAPRRPEPPLARTTTVAPIPAPVATSSRPAAAEPAAAPTPPPVAVAPAPAAAPVAAPPAPEVAPAAAPAPSAGSAVSPGAGANLP